LHHSLSTMWLSIAPSTIMPKWSGRSKNRSEYTASVIILSGIFMDQCTLTMGRFLFQEHGCLCLHHAPHDDRHEGD
jgi:hypothetical protein